MKPEQSRTFGKKIVWILSNAANCEINVFNFTINAINVIDKRRCSN